MRAYPASTPSSLRTTTKVSLLHLKLTDHIGGLIDGNPYGGFSQPKLDWCFGTIYTSEVSKSILLTRFPHLRPYVQGLTPMRKYTVKGRTICLIEANHCPGACMVMISDGKQTVLHTGDFRYRHKLLSDLKLVLPDLPLSHLYLDNTFATTAEAFPSQQVAYNMLL